MTPAVVRALDEARRVADHQTDQLQLPDEPSLEAPIPGNPISHDQLIALSKFLRRHADQLHNADDPFPYSLDTLLKGCTIYVPPPPPKREPTPEYKALMERLRREEEARQYQRMINPPAPEALYEEDDVSYQEVHRQIILIINVLISVVCCSVFIWVAARHWSAPKRLGLSLSGSGLIAVAEVVIYNGYVRRIKQAKLEEKKKPEIKKIIESWVIDGSATTKDDAVSIPSKDYTEDGVRYRKGKHR
ncbi:hypothetical protein M011DRAFT_403635 [Sporormia fimetaria CBS 119925]|uniref:Endoplasmic reticulum-based factor for assembly of V-ATPase n=1 Tax=Sporormia fimetaria CBS 119925 TaxID=1340428 RepID=A0A6A6VAX2_9PLEO|nr:hypothetical protein M011DRAFT_403635 [Sporormia fimetaria CBS 119925]